MIRFRVAEGVMKDGTGCKHGVYFTSISSRAQRMFFTHYIRLQGLDIFSNTTNNNYMELSPSWDTDSRSTGHKIM